MCQHEGAATVMVGGMEVELCEDCMPRPTVKKVSEHDGKEIDSNDIEAGSNDRFGSPYSGQGW